MHASEITRFFPLESGLGYGSARVSVLFRPVKATLPPNLLGFDVGTLIVRKVNVTPSGDDRESVISTLQSCEVKFKTSSSSDKFSRKASNRDNNGDIVWHAEEEPLVLPVHQRYSSALIMTFKNTHGLGVGKEGMAVLWLRDVVDNEDKSNECALFKSNEYSRLKQNYVPPDGDLRLWNQGAEGYKRIGTVRVELTFQPGIAESHEKVMNTHDPAQKRVWDEVDRRDTVGLQEKVGEQGGGGKATPGPNTEVDEGDVKVEEGTDGPYADDQGEEESDTSDNEGTGLMAKLRKWKQHEKELHQQHRGIMQVKPARTAKWLGNNIEEVGHKVKDRFRMKSRQPDVETEV